MNQLSGHFSYRDLMKFTFPSIIMMIFTSFYGVVDGLFVSNFAGKTALAAVNFIIPFLMLLGGTGFMFGNGGSALVAKILGEDKKDEADNVFSSLIISSVATGFVLILAGRLAIKPLCIFLGAEGELLRDSLIYGRIYLWGVPASIVQYEFQNLFVTSGKPKMGLYSTVASGLTNILLDALFVGAFSWGLEGAAAATVFSQSMGALIPIVYFYRENTSLLRFRLVKIDFPSLLKICSNGFSELLNNVSMTIVSMVYNFQLLRYAGETGLAAYGILMYINFFFISVFIGYVVGVSPVISYNYGALNKEEITSLIKKSIVIIAFSSLLMFITSQASANTVAKLFVSYDKELFDMTVTAFRLFSFNFLFAGFAIFSSSFFTSLNNGFLSAVISFMRTIFFEISFVIILPLVLDIEGIWLSCPFAELLAFILGFSLIAANRKKYGY